MFRDFNSVFACEVHLPPAKENVLYIYSRLWSLENMWNGQNVLFCQLQSVVYKVYGVWYRVVNNIWILKK